MNNVSNTLDKSLANRKILKNYLDSIETNDLFKIPDGFNNNIIWQIGHVISVQQQLVYGLSGLPLHVSKEFTKKYGRGSFPDAQVNEETVEELQSLLFTTLETIKEDLEKDIFKNFTPYKTLPGIVLESVSDALEFNNFHDDLHLKRIKSLTEALHP